MYEKNGIQHWNRKYMFMFKRDYIYPQSQIVNLTYLDYLTFCNNTTHVGF